MQRCPFSHRDPDLIPGAIICPADRKQGLHAFCKEPVCIHHLIDGFNNLQGHTSLANSVFAATGNQICLVDSALLPLPSPDAGSDGKWNSVVVERDSSHIFLPSVLHFGI